MAKGYLQRYGIDFKETYAAVARTVTSRIFIALAAYFGWLIEQVDIMTAFLNTNLDFVIYLKLPEGYFPKGKVAKALKTLYSLKQSVRL